MVISVVAELKKLGLDLVRTRTLLVKCDFVDKSTNIYNQQLSMSDFCDVNNMIVSSLCDFAAR